MTQRRSGGVAVVGAGSWGTALAGLLASRGRPVRLWAYEREVCESINERQVNPLYTSDLHLPSTVRATNDLEEAVHRAEMVLFVIPAQLTRGYLRQLRQLLPEEAPLVICSKGIERQSLATMDRVFADELGPQRASSVCVLSGPSFAAEVAQGMPTNVTVAGRDQRVTRAVQETMATRSFRVYTTEDVIGVELGGALKNVIAVAVGGSDGLGFGHNTRAGLITRGLAEITRLAVHLGGRPETMLGLAGVGDLILTCTSDLSRNRTVGKLLAQGRPLVEIEREMRMVAEGVATAESAHALALQQGVDMPITQQVCEVLYQGKTVPAAMAALQDRALKEEWQ